LKYHNEYQENNGEEFDQNAANANEGLELGEMISGLD